MNEEISFKELYEVALKSTLPIEVGETQIAAGEIVALFDKIQIANFTEVKNNANAHGGFDNRGYVFWSSTKEINISFTQGVFSKTQLGLMTNAKLIIDNGLQSILISAREEQEVNEQGQVSLSHELCAPIFVYDKDTGEKITGWSYSDHTITLLPPYKEVIVDYQYEYEGGYTDLLVGRSLISGFLSLEGKMRVKDDDTGKVTTGIIKIPKLKLMSGLSIRVGSDAIPQVGRLDAVAVPEGTRGNQKVMEIYFLNDDIDADM